MLRAWQRARSSARLGDAIGSSKVKKFKSLKSEKAKKRKSEKAKKRKSLRAGVVR